MEYVGSGYKHLSSVLTSRDISEQAKDLLAELLAEDPGMNASGQALVVTKQNRKPPSLLCMAFLDSTMSDSTILDLASRGEISLLCSILSVIDEAGGSAVTSKRLLQTCSLAVRPSHTPGLLDAREMVLAVLHFLSQDLSNEAMFLHIPEGPSLPSLESLLPLIRPLSNTSDLERRSYEKCYNWALSSIVQQIAVLEWYLLNGGNDYRWLPRVAFLPTTEDPSVQRQILLKGRMEKDKRSAKQTKPESVQPIQFSGNKHPVAAEASRIMAETNGADSP